MKHILLSTAALAGLAIAAAAPAAAQEPALQLGVSGYAAGYAVYTGGDSLFPGVSQRKFDFRKHSEVYLSGEVALDNGITAGAHIEIQTDRADNGNLSFENDPVTGVTSNVEYNRSNIIQESYIYLSSNWGRVNFGEEDGVGYLLQVAAPSADSNVDGLRPVIGTIGSGLVGGYAMDAFGYQNKFTYITPVFSGFQAGVSFAPSLGDDQNGLSIAEFNKQVGEYQNGLEFAARYEGSFDAVDLAIGAGYQTAALENKSGTRLVDPNADNFHAWNVGANVGFGAFGVGAAYLNSNEGVKNHGDERVWVAGVDYKTGPYKLGLSYQNAKAEDGPGINVKADQWTAGGVYEWGPGMTFRGAVQYVDGKVTGGQSRDAVQVTMGTQLNF